MEDTLFFLKFRENGILQEGLVTAQDAREAIAIGQRYCRAVGNRQYINVRAALVADRSILSGSIELPKPPKGWEQLTAKPAQDAVNRGDITVEDAITIEKRGQNRKGMLEWLASKLVEEAKAS